MAPSGFSPKELTEFGDDDGRTRVSGRSGVEDYVGAVDRAGEHQELGEEDARAKIPRASAHLGIGRRDRRAELAGVEQSAGGVIRCGGFGGVGHWRINPTCCHAGHAVTPDAAMCTDCLRELLDARDRRYRYAFINCTECGPRYTLTGSLPYDRSNTSMTAFAQCLRCLQEYTSPGERRFHAEPNACPECGPQLVLLNAQGTPFSAADAIAETVARLRRGEIIAVKGLGGFHLACDARNREAVARLRSRKEREEKPFAVMLTNAASARQWARVLPEEEELLTSPERPIVLLRKARKVDLDLGSALADLELPGVAHDAAWLGVMLPYTPLHYLLFHEAAGRPSGLAWLNLPQHFALVMTSANPGGEPLVIGNDEAVRRLKGIADAYLVHDREILVRCDDSVLRVTGSPETGHPPSFAFIRRARGYTPRAIKLDGAGPSVLALGGHFKNTVCLTRGDEAFISQHIGDLDNAASCEALIETIEHLQRILGIEPQVVAHDLHPDFFSSRHGAQLAQALGVPKVAVQHHHAHIAAVLAEHRCGGLALGLALDGVGLGEDGSAWGGELLLVDGAHCQRLGHLRKLALPGGDRAAREPWRMAAAALHSMHRADEIAWRFPAQPAAEMVAKMLAQRLNAPLTSSMGRWFDAAAGLTGVREVMAFEGQAAMLLEGLAASWGPVAPHADAWRIDPDGVLDLLPLLAALSFESNAARGAAAFHATLIEALAAWVQRAARASGVRTVACGGGCFLNDILATGLRRRLAESGLTVLTAQQLPPNDGGLALGQAWVARRSVMNCN